VSGMCGWVSDDVAALPIEQMGAPLVRHEQLTLRSIGGRWGTLALAAPATEATLAQDDDVLVALLGRPVAGLPAMWRRYGTAMPQHLHGAFALAVIDQRSGQALLATDRSGVHPLCYQLVGRTLAFASSSDALIRHPCVGRQIDSQSIYNYLYFHVVPAPGSVYRGHHRLLPGELVHFHEGRVQQRRYWQLAFSESQLRPFDALKDELIGTLRQAVRLAAGTRRVGVLLSGGMDSSTITALLSDVTGVPARTYSTGFEVAGYDTMRQARLVAAHFETRHQERFITPADVIDAVPDLGAAFDQPFGNGSAVSTYFSAQMARADGLDCVLAPDGGNELFGGNERYARQAIFSRYEKLPSALRQLLIEPLLYCIGRRNLSRLARGARNYIEQSLLSVPARLETENVLHRFGHANVLEPHFLASVDSSAPLNALAATYGQWAGFSQINQLLGLDMQFTVAGNELPKVSKMCELSGVRVAFPLLEDSVVVFAARLPPQYKLNGTRMRYFFKEAMRGILPPPALHKQAHRRGLPFAHWLRTDQRLREFAFDHLSDLKGRHIVRADFIDRMCTVHHVEPTDDHATMVWVLMMLEQWFVHRRQAWSAPRPNHQRAPCYRSCPA
jgi:asparagine synthase (glutamine-hydrolysing)